MGDLLLDLDERDELRPRGEGVYSRGDGERDKALSPRLAGETDLFRGGEEALSLSARER